MAVSDVLPGVEVTIVSGNAKLKEYEDDDIELEGQERTITRYVEAVSGQEFEIHWRVDESVEFLGDCMTFHIYVDGQRVMKRYTTDREVERRGFSLKRCKGYEVSATETRRFCFAGLDIGEHRDVG